MRFPCLGKVDSFYQCNESDVGIDIVEERLWVWGWALFEMEFEELFADEVSPIANDSPHIRFDDCDHEFLLEGLDRICVKDPSNVPDFG